MRRLTTELCKWRAASGLTCEEAGARIGMSASTISRLERAIGGIGRDDLISLLAVYEVPRVTRDALIKLYEDAQTPGMLERSDLHSDLAKWIDFEQDATRIRNYEPLLVPGLLQTADYARAVISAFDPRLTGAQVDQRVRARMARQQLLARPQAPNLDVVLHQAALRHEVGGREVMRRQLDHLVAMATHAVVTIRVVPLDAGAHSGMEGAFVITDYLGLSSVVHLENRVASLYLEEPEDVDSYNVAFRGLLSVAREDWHGMAQEQLQRWQH